MVKEILYIGKTQGGKTTYVVDKYIGDKQSPNDIVVMINYQTNTAMENTNKKIKLKDVKLYSGLGELRAFYTKFRKNGVEEGKKYVLSLTTHYQSLKKVKDIIGAFAKQFDSKYSFIILIDESDQMSLNHKKCKEFTHKKRELQAMRELSCVKEMSYITSTPHTELFSEVDFTDVIDIPVGEEYAGYDNLHIHDCFTKQEFNSIHNGEKVEPRMKEWILNQLDMKGITLIQSGSKKKQHSNAFTNIVDIVGNKALVCIHNSDELFDFDEAVKIAKYNNLEKIFIIAFYNSDRTNTFRTDYRKDKSFSNITGALTNGTGHYASTVLQRVGRLCGYPIDKELNVYCTKETEVNIWNCLEHHDKLMSMSPETMKKAKARKEFLSGTDLDLRKQRHKNTARKGYAQEMITTDKVIGMLLTTQYKGEVPDSISMDNLNLKENTELKNYLQKEIGFERILQGKKHWNMMKPNNSDKEENYRDCIIEFTGGRNYTAIHQPFGDVIKSMQYSLHTFEGNYKYNLTDDGVVFDG